MKPQLTFLTLALAGALTIARAAAPEFFAMDTGTKDATHQTAGQQVALVEEVGFAGIAPIYHNPELLRDTLAELDQRKLKILAVYVPLDLDSPTPVSPAIRDVIEQLRGRDAFLWLYVNFRAHQSSDPAGDAKAVPVMREMADLAKEAGVRVSLYPHLKNWVERVEDGARLAKQVNRENFGVTFNLCHWLMVGDTDLNSSLHAALPHLQMVTINGADAGNKELKACIQPLGSGTFDVGGVLTKLAGLGWNGPIGLQHFGIQGNAKANLQRSMDAWRNLSRRAWPTSGGAASAGIPWQRDSRNLLTNFNNMYQPCVVETGGEYPYKMWFFGWAAAATNPGWPGCDAIFLARSKDLKSWEVFGGKDTWDTTMSPKQWIPVLHASDRWYDAWHVGDPSVVLKDNVYYMAYSATSKHFGERAGYPATMVQCVMGAVSEDGISWKKTGQPLLIRADDTADPKPDPDRIGDFHRPCLRWDDGKWRLWFDYWLPGRGVCMGYAQNIEEFEAAGGFKIQIDLRQPLIEGWPNPDIIRIGDTYHSFSDAPGYPGASGWKARQLREAISKDGINWQLMDFVAPDEDADANHVPQAFATTIDGNRWLYLFYATQIGNGRNDGTYHYEYDRIRAMRRPIDNSESDPSR